MSEVERPKSVVSQSSSIITVSSISPGSKPTRPVKKVHTFGKREHSIKRDPNTPVVIRGWLYKQDSSGLKLWKRRWFVLSNFCVFYYRDSREETVLGSMSLPSYKVMPAEPKEVKNRKFAFKAEHLGMRTYYFSADTQEDMTGWVRAMNQSALVELASNSKAPSLSDINCILQDERYTSYEDFTHPGLMQNPEHAKSAESLEVTELSEKRGDMDFLEERVIGSEDTGRMIKKMPLFALSMERCTPRAQNGAAPPPTPVNGVQDDSFHYERDAMNDSVEEGQAQCLLQVHEWVRSQKEKMSLGKASRTGEVEQHQEKSLDSSEWPCHGSIRQDIVSSDYTHYCERPSCPTQTEVDLSISRPVRVTRSSSLPPSPSEVAGYQLLKRPNTPDNRMRTQSTNENAIRYVQEETPKQRPLASSHSPVEKKRTPSQRASGQISRRGQKSQASLGRHDLDSSEDLSLSGSFGPVSRSLIRPHTPVGRVDIHPIEVISVGYTQDSKHQEDKHNEHLISTIRSKTSLVGPASRPQTPSDRYDVLPFEDIVWPSPHVKLLNNLNKQKVKSPQPGPVDERYIDESSMTLPCRVYGTSGRSHGRASAPIERGGVSPPVDRQAESCQTTPSLGRHRNQAAKHLSLYQERCYTPQPPYTSRSSTPRLQGKMLSTHSSSAAYAQLPPLPPVASRSSTPGQSVKRLSLSVTPTSEIYRERLHQTVRLTESDVDVLLTRLCGQDKFLQSLTAEAAELKADKERLESALEMTRMQMEEFKDQPAVSEKITCQQRFFQEDMITIRAKLCNLSMEIERAWNDYMRLETELLVHKASLEQIQHSGLPQEQSEAQRQLWMVEDIMSGLTASKNNLQMAVESARYPVLTSLPPPPLERLPSVQSNLLHLSALESPTQQQQLMADNELPKDSEDVPPRPPLPKDTMSATEDEAALDRNGKAVQAEGKTLSSKKPVEEKEGKGMVNANSRPHIGNGTDTLSRKTRMSAEEQLERIRKHQQAQIYERIKSVTLGQRRTPEPQQGSARHQASNKCSMDVNSCHAENVNRQKGMTANLPASSKVAPSCAPAATLISPSDSSCKAAANEESSTMDRAGSPAHAEMARLPLIRQTVQSEQQGDTKDTGVYSVSSTTVSPLCSVTTISLKQISVPVTGLASPLRTTNKLLTARPSPQTLEDAGEQHSHAEDMAKVKVNKMVVTGRYMEFDPDVTLTADQLEAKQKKVEKIKTMVAQTSPGAAAGSCTWHSASGDIYTLERERDRIINLSYILATEASQRSKLITGRVFADLPPHADDIHTDSGSEWEPVLQDVHSDGQEEKDRSSTSCDSQEDSSPEYHADQVFMLPSEIPDNLYSSVSNTVLSRETVSEKLTVTEMQETATQDFLNNNQLASRHPQQSGKCSRSGLACDCGVKELTVTGDPCSFGLESNKEVASLVEEYIQRDKEPIRITVLQSSL
ncbi:pleckstrin homology domain-containing family A member 4 isoform X2 [Protopterus annectens]|uniref:pleckstrin homology domain-containing family A member 4 isoform X2 n=1 Tax=Protopterus annectens TaxID=7888 RepID=UPI001CFA3A05|nr:pleckstrin homology domain-containing family A member 4 isoform X2 [Protopterus annectens]